MGSINSLFWRIVMCYFIFSFKGIRTEGEDFNALMKNVDSFIRDSQKVITQLNYEIEKSNETLDRIALDSRYTNLLSGKEEKEIDDLEHQLGKGMVVVQNNAEFNRNESPIRTYMKTGHESKNNRNTNNIKRILSYGTSEKSITNPLSSKSKQNKHEENEKIKAGISNSLIKRQNSESTKQVNVSSPEVKIIGTVGDGSTVCIIVKPYLCNGATFATPTKRKVTYINYEPFFIPPIKNSGFETATINNNASEATKSEGMTTTEMNSAVYTSSIDSYRKDIENHTISIPLNNESILLSIINLNAFNNVSTYSPKRLQIFDNLEQINPLTNTTSTVEPPSYSGVHSSRIEPIFETNPLATTANIPTLIPVVELWDVNEEESKSNASSSHLENTSVSTSWGNLSQSTKPVKPWNKLFRKKKINNSHKLETSTRTPYSKTENENSSFKKYYGSAPLNIKNGSTLLLTYSVHGGNKNNTLAYNIESISIIQNDSVTNINPTIVQNNRATESNDKDVGVKNVNFSFDAIRNIFIQPFNTQNRSSDNERTTTTYLTNTKSEAHFEQSITGKPDIDQELKISKSTKQGNSSLSDTSSIFIPTQHSLTDLVMLIESLNDIAIKNPSHHSISKTCEPLNGNNLICGSEKTMGCHTNTISITSSNGSLKIDETSHPGNYHDDGSTPSVAMLVPLSDSMLLNSLLSGILQKAQARKSTSNGSSNTRRLKITPSSIAIYSQNSYKYADQNGSLLPAHNYKSTGIPKESTDGKNFTNNIVKRIVFYKSSPHRNRPGSQLIEPKNSVSRLYIKSKTTQGDSNVNEIKTPLEMYIVDPELSLLKQGLKMVKDHP